MGHLNVRNYMAKFDDAAWTLLSLLGVTNRYFDEQNAGVAAIEHKVTYQRELMPGDAVEIHSRVLMLEGKKFKFRHEMRHSLTGEICAICELFGVHMDRAIRRASAFPADIIHNAQSYLECE